MSYQKDRDEFVAVIVEEFGTEALQKRGRAMPLEDRKTTAVEFARLVLSNASTIQRIATNECNRELTDGERRQDAAAQQRIIEACRPWGIGPTFNGDPRGVCVKLILPSGRYNSFGGAEDGFCVPTR